MGNGDGLACKWSGVGTRQVQLVGILSFAPLAGYPGLSRGSRWLVRRLGDRSDAAMGQALKNQLSEPALQVFLRCNGWR